MYQLKKPSHQARAENFLGIQDLGQVPGHDFRAYLIQGYVTIYTNTLSQINLLGAIRGRSKKPRFLVVGSSEEYGPVYEDELPLKEANLATCYCPTR